MSGLIGNQWGRAPVFAVWHESKVAFQRTTLRNFDPPTIAICDSIAAISWVDA